MTDKISRRVILVTGLQAPIAGALLFGLGGCSGGASSGGTAANKAGGTVCADLSAMSDGDQSTRKAMNYTESGPNPNQVCGGCSFFHAGGGACGTCDMFSGGPVNSHGHCDSWNAKA
jgi:hypothetical protein